MNDIIFRIYLDIFKWEFHMKIYFKYNKENWYVEQTLLLHYYRTE